MSHDERLVDDLRAVLTEHTSGPPGRDLDLAAVHRGATRRHRRTVGLAIGGCAAVALVFVVAFARPWTLAEDAQPLPAVSGTPTPVDLGGEQPCRLEIYEPSVVVPGQAEDVGWVVAYFRPPESWFGFPCTIDEVLTVGSLSGPQVSTEHRDVSAAPAPRFTRAARVENGDYLAVVVEADNRGCANDPAATFTTYRRGDLELRVGDESLALAAPLMTCSGRLAVSDWYTGAEPPPWPSLDPDDYPTCASDMFMNDAPLTVGQTQVHGYFVLANTPVGGCVAREQPTITYEGDGPPPRFIRGTVDDTNSGYQGLNDPTRVLHDGDRLVVIIEVAGGCAMIGSQRTAYSGQDLVLNLGGSSQTIHGGTIRSCGHRLTVSDWYQAD